MDNTLEKEMTTIDQHIKHVLDVQYEVEQLIKYEANQTDGEYGEALMNAVNDIITRYLGDAYGVTFELKDEA